MHVSGKNIFDIYLPIRQNILFTTKSCMFRIYCNEFKNSREMVFAKLVRVLDQ